MGFRMQVFQAALDGIIAGLPIGLLALAFMVAYLPSRVFFVALGGIYALAPFWAGAMLSRGIPPAWAVPAALAAGALLAMACELFNHRPLARKAASPGAHLISSLGIYLVLVQGVALVCGNDSQTLRHGLDQVFRVGTTTLASAQVITVAVSCGVLLAVWVWLRTTSLGLQFRAISDNPRELAARGYNTNRLRLIAFAFSGLLASTAALVTARDVGFDPHCGLPALLLAVVAFIVGGRETFAGPVLGGLVLGITRGGTEWFFSAQWKEAATFILLVAMLYIRPSGILGSRGRLEAAT